MKNKKSYGIVMSLFFVASFVLLSGCTSNNDNSWLDNYTPVHSVGTGSNNFWINFPYGNPSFGQNVTHLTWITEDLKEKPVVFVCHRTGCDACTPQANRVKALMKTYGEDVIFYDLDYPFEGYGVATEDTLKKLDQAFYYDPDGPPGYIALTGVFTYVKENNDIKIGWHSLEAPNDMTVSDSDLESWIKDAIYYYSVNK